MKLLWGDKIGLPECPYMERWVADFGPFAIRVHHWFKSDDARALHCHAWWFITLILKGGYTDVSPTGEDKVGPGSVRYREANHRHTVQVNPGGCWTVLITGKPIRRWGFWVDGKLIKRDKYFATSGHHQCDGPDGVRIRPDGSRI